ncbi:hypothetical protein [Cribrihabitans neustonicus]
MVKPVKTACEKPAPATAAERFAGPEFVVPEFSLAAMLSILPAAIAPAI